MSVFDLLSPEGGMEAIGEAERDAWARMLAWLERHLKDNPAANPYHY